MVEASDTALPRFTYHPDPLATGSFVLSSTECLACAKSRGWIYVGPTYCEAELDDHLCPSCIADGTAHRKFGVEFVDPLGVGASLPHDRDRWLRQLIRNSSWWSIGPLC